MEVFASGLCMAVTSASIQRSPLEWISSTRPAINPQLSRGYSLSQAQICFPFLLDPFADTQRNSIRPAS